MKKTNFLILTLFAVLILASNDAFAQSFGTIDDINFDDDVNDEPVSIFGHIFMVISMTFALILGYTKFVRK